LRGADDPIDLVHVRVIVVLADGLGTSAVKTIGGEGVRVRVGVVRVGGMEVGVVWEMGMGTEMIGEEIGMRGRRRATIR
jgi:hypothetical protein